jgi:tRNA A-37 threonylcarbamoyl transferase component Bud32
VAVAGAGDPSERDRDSADLPELSVTGTGLPPSIGTQTLAGLLGERYRVVSRLGAGAFGEVYRAHDSVLGRDVAVKRIRLEAFVEAAQLDEVKKRFLREAQVAARLRHPNIVTTHDIVAGPVSSFIVMELVEGQTLQALLQEKGRLGFDETLSIVAQAAAALDHAHDSQIVHRDVKPGNIMIEPSGHVKVMDFGIAKIETGGNLTSTGLIMGTPNYMSPEQARGQKVDRRSDLFSLGCVLYECLTGAKPFMGESVTAILVKILTEEPPAVDFAATGLPPELGSVLRRTTAKDPAQRYGTGAELVDALRVVGQTTMVTPPTAGRPPVPQPRPPAPSSQPGTATAQGAPPRRRRWALAGIAAAVLLVAALCVAVVLAPRGGTTRVAGDGGGHVVEEAPGLLGRLTGQQPRLVVTVPSGTRLRLALETPLSSETARPGDALSAELTDPVRVEGVEALAAGQRLTGRIEDAAPAEAADGRGRMTLRFDSLEATGQRLDVRCRPLVLRAPGTKRKDAGIIASLAGVGAAVGGLLGGKGGAVAGTVAGGAAGVAIVTTAKGHEVTLAARAPLTIELVEPARVTRPKP